MDRFKSRVWSIEENCYVDKAFVIACTSGELISLLVHMKYDYSKFIIEQCTGLKDQDGKLIFENDKLQLDDIILTVTWFDGGFHILSSDNQARSPLVQDRAKRFKIIGTIHEVKND